MKPFTPQQMFKIRYRYLQHTGSIEEEPRQINFEGQKTKRNALKLETGKLISQWLEKCVINKEIDYEK